MSESPPRRFWLLALLSAAAGAIVSACKTAPGPAPGPTRTPAAPPVSAAPPEPSAPVVGPPVADPIAGPIASPIAGPKGSARSSPASTARAYRESGASHLYGLNADRIYKGKMPSLLYAIGVLNVEINRVGIVTRLEWMRAPRHAPEVIAEIERLIQSASPFPAPTRLGKVVYTDTWLWHKSGKFQLDTLTEGQN